MVSWARTSPCVKRPRGPGAQRPRARNQRQTLCQCRQEVCFPVPGLPRCAACQQGRECSGRLDDGPPHASVTSKPESLPQGVSHKKHLHSQVLLPFTLNRKPEVEPGLTT